jgi:sugar-specific transcriptional regulator TrmB
MDDSTLRERLAALGLSEKEVATYLSVLESGGAKASEIASDTGVSKRYVYSLAEQLEARGMVEVDDHATPTRVRPRPPEEVIDSLAAQLEEMETALESRYAEEDEPETQFDVIKARATVLGRLADSIDQATNEITLTLPRRYLEEVQESLAAAVERGVLVLLVVTDAPEGEITPADVEGLASVVRTTPQPTPIMLTVDQSFGLVSPLDVVSRADSDQQAIAFVQPRLVPVIVGSFLGNYWQMAQELVVAEPLALPGTFTNFRQAVHQATCWLREETPVEMHAAVTPVNAEDDRETLSGIVVETRQGLVRPETNSYPIQHSLLVDTGEGTVTVGGPGSFLEDYETSEVELRAVEESR